jgi:hypothetical protein
MIKLMLSSCLVVAVAIATTFVAPSASADNVDHGGMSGGGGGTGTAHPVAAKEITESIKYSKVFVSGWFNQLEFLYQINDEGYWRDNYHVLGPAPAPLLSKMFDQKTKVFDVINSLKIEVRRTRPCLDKSGAKVDGSIYADSPGAICLSLPRLVKKLNDATLEKQISALIIHEITHLVGGDEAEAVTAQTYALASFQFHNRSEVNEKVFLSAVPQTQELANVFEWMTPQASPTELCHYAEIIQSTCGQVFDIAFNEVYNYSPLTHEEFGVINRDLFVGSRDVYKKLCSTIPATLESVQSELTLMKMTNDDLHRKLMNFTDQWFEINEVK